MKEEKKFSERLADLIQGDGFKGAADKTGIHPRSMENYAKGKGEPGLKNLVKIAEGYNVQVGWLAAGEEPKYRPKNGNGSTDKVVDVNAVYKRKIDSIDKEARVLFERILELREKSPLDGYSRVAALISEQIEKLETEGLKKINGE